MREKNQKTRNKPGKKRSKNGRIKRNLLNEKSAKINWREKEHLVFLKPVEDSVHFSNIQNPQVQKNSKKKKKSSRYERDLERLNLRGNEKEEVNFSKEVPNSQTDEKQNESEWRNRNTTDFEKPNMERIEAKEANVSKDNPEHQVEKKLSYREQQNTAQSYLKKRDFCRTNLTGTYAREVKFMDEKEKEADMREAKSAFFLYPAEKQEVVSETDFFRRKWQSQQAGETKKEGRRQKKNHFQSSLTPSFSTHGLKDLPIRDGNTKDKTSDRETEEYTVKELKVRDGEVAKNTVRTERMAERETEPFFYLKNRSVGFFHSRNEARNSNLIKKNQKKKQIQRNFQKKKEQKHVEEEQKKSSQKETIRHEKNQKTENPTSDAFREKTKGNSKPRRFHQEQEKSSSHLLFEEKGSARIHGMNRSIAKKVGSVAEHTARCDVPTKEQEAEQENTAVEGAYQTGLLAERMICHAHHASNRRKLRQTFRLQEADRKAVSSHRLRFETAQEMGTIAKTYHGMEAKPSKKSAKKRFWQKQKIKQAYQAAKRGEKRATETGKAAQTLFEKAKHTTLVVVQNNKEILGMAAILGLLFLIFSILLSGGGAILQGTSSSIIGTTYPSKTEEIYGVEADYTTRETALNRQINDMELVHPGYDEYRYQIDEISHDPYQLISYLTVRYEEFTYEQVKDILPELFSEQYRLTVEELVEIRTRTETYFSVHPETGEWMEEEREEEYEYRILCISLENQGFDTVARNRLTAEQTELYAIYNFTYGNRKELFDGEMIPSGNGASVEGFGYEIPAEALSEEEFANFLHEAETYLGYPYVWGGASPSTGFDCSGFVSWVINHCGNGWSMGRQTVDGLLRHCAYVSPSEAKPGDLIFFQGTYDTPGASHVGIYIGNQQMIHCGNPVQYANLNTAYWQQHFYAYGRIE